jgi:hypothetical protein
MKEISLKAKSRTCAVPSPSSTITKHLSRFLKRLTDLKVSVYCEPVFGQELGYYNDTHSTYKIQDIDNDT